MKSALYILAIITIFFAYHRNIQQKQIWLWYCSKYYAREENSYRFNFQKYVKSVGYLHFI